MTNIPNDNTKDEPTHSILDFLTRVIDHKKKLPVCQDEHDWILINGQGYDYNSDYYLCKKCELKIQRQDFEL